ncbi:MAG: hypothetical protein NTV97_24720 [Alphaproteobacteria bacterium]|nr:hypothetical protein [Alphaproteobacteria bacterium]
MTGAPSMKLKEKPMLDLMFLGGGVALFCLLIGYERLCSRL